MVLYLYAAAQAPSEDTMQGPTGSSGTQRLPKSGHSAGLRRPVMTSPQRQAVGFVSSPYATPNFFSAS